MILPLNSSKNEKAFAGHLLKRMDLDLSGISILPKNAKKEILPYLAQMLQVDISGLDLIKDEKEVRSLLESAFTIHKHDGTVYSLQRVLSNFFTEYKIREWFKESWEPYTFGIDVKVKENYLLSPEKFKNIFTLIDQAKNTRSYCKRILIQVPEHFNKIYTRTAVFTLVKMEFVSR